MDKEIKHGGCYRCGNMNQEILTSITIRGHDYKPMSIAVCETCRANLILYPYKEGRVI